MASAPHYQRLADDLSRQIASGALKPGDKLPTEAELTERFGLSRITVREALKILQNRGLIERFARRGSFVRRRSEKNLWEMRSIDDLIELGTDTETRIISWGLVDPPGEMARLFGGDDRLYRLRAVRIRRDARTPIYFAQNYLVRRLGEKLRVEDLAKRTIVDLLRNELSVRLEAATEEIEVGAATAELARHLGIAHGKPVLLQRINLFDEGDRILQAGMAWWRADQIRRRFSVVQHPVESIARPSRRRRIAE
ncbi:MAG: hypothetical protein BGP06_13080 [Rhizobiales bacterium 65-9]|nr:GntR family transcriptional regulator [Hyphomicrobiales bacterium]OJY39339.1 MAG: hypothetical protein BGP06_13080 [Rhizobiales bacterium 65-9]